MVYCLTLHIAFRTQIQAVYPNKLSLPNLHLPFLSPMSGLWERRFRFGFNKRLSS